LLSVYGGTKGYLLACDIKGYQVADNEGNKATNKEVTITQL
jgi:hypothetical protein